MRNTHVSIALFALATACGPQSGRRLIPAHTDLGTASGPPAGDASMTPAASGDLSCGGQEFAIQRVQPNVFLVLDRSGSMASPIAGNSNTTKWADLQNAINGLVTTFGGQMRLGLSLFAGDDDCEAGQIDLQLAPNNGAAVLAQLSKQSPNSGTPTGATMTNVQMSGGLTDMTRQNVIVLATDGVPDCEPNEVNAVTATITALAAGTPSVKTFVIGIGGDTASSPTALNAWATAGGTALTGTTKYYQTNSSTDLDTAFQQIAGGVASCTFALGSTPPDPSELYVWENQTQVAADATNGYTYSASPPSVTLNGTSCDSLKNDTSVQLKVIYGCPGPPPIS